MAQHTPWHGWTSFVTWVTSIVQFYHTQSHQSGNFAILGQEQEVGWMAENYDELWQEVLNTYEVLWWLIIHYGMDEEALKSDYGTQFSFTTVIYIGAEIGHFGAYGGGRMAKWSRAIWQEVLHTYEVIQWLNIHHDMDEQAALKSEEQTWFSWSTHNRIRVEVGHFGAWRG